MAARSDSDRAREANRPTARTPSIRMQTQMHTQRSIESCLVVGCRCEIGVSDSDHAAVVTEAAVTLPEHDRVPLWGRCCKQPGSKAGCTEDQESHSGPSHHLNSNFGAGLVCRLCRLGGNEEIVTPGRL